MFKKVITTLLAADFAFGAISCGVKKAEERTLVTMSAIEQRIDEGCESWNEYTPKILSDNYIKDSLGAFSLTFYVPDEEWGYQTATGVRSQHLATCAVDPKVIPLGSVIQITGNNGQTLTLKCVDVGGGIKGNRVDIFFDSNTHGGVQAGYNWMAQFGTIHNVYIVEE